MQSEIKKNIQGTDSEGKNTRTQINVWNKRKKQTFNQNRIEKQEFKKMRGGLGTSRTTLDIPTSESQGCQKEKKKSKKWKTNLNK